MPSEEGNVLAQVDFISLEPRVAYLLTHDDSPKDIYGEMSTFVTGDVPRSKLKVATISALYGSAKVDQSIAKEVSRFFNIDRIWSECLSGDKLYNLYGRPLNPESDHLKLSHYVQSTAVDVSLQAFSSFVDRYDIKPYFMIHDSLVFECDKETYDSMTSTELFSDVDGLGRFYLSMNRFVEDI
jgi:hypothetical protein